MNSNQQPETYDKLLLKIELISKKIDVKLSANPDFVFFDNQQFCCLMNISKKTAGIWRNDNLISYSKIGTKYYYRLSDILLLLHCHYYDSFKQQ